MSCPRIQDVFKGPEMVPASLGMFSPAGSFPGISLGRFQGVFWQNAARATQGREILRVVREKIRIKLCQPKENIA